MIALLLALLSRYKIAAECIVGAALLAFVIYQGHEFLEHERDIGRNEVRAEYSKQLADAKDAAAKIETDWRAKYNAAIQQGAANEKALRVAAAATASAADSLRDTNAELRRRLPGATAEAARAYAATISRLLDDCKEQYRQVGQDAQGYANDAATLSSAYPKGK